MAESEPELSELRERLIGDWVRVRDVFEEWDEDGSGTIDRVEWLHAVGSLCGMLPDAAGRLYDLLDADGNGTLDYKELNKELRRGASVELDAALQDGYLGEIETESKNKHSLRKDGPQTTRSRVITLEMGAGATVLDQIRNALAGSWSRVRELFREWDEDESGSISKREFRRALVLLGLRAPRNEVDALFDTFDKDGSGEVDFGERGRAPHDGAHCACMCMRVHACACVCTRVHTCARRRTCMHMQVR